MNFPKQLVDMLDLRRYKRRRFLGVILFTLLMPGAAEAREHLGATIPDGSTPIGENRFRSPVGYNETLTWYGKVYRSNQRKAIVNRPGLRAVHIVNEAKGRWEGLNIYELDGKTVIFVVPRD